MYSACHGIRISSSDSQFYVVGMVIIYRSCPSHKSTMDQWSKQCWSIRWLLATTPAQNSSAFALRWMTWRNLCSSIWRSCLSRGPNLEFGYTVPDSRHRTADFVRYLTRVCSAKPKIINSISSSQLPYTALVEDMHSHECDSSCVGNYWRQIPYHTLQYVCLVVACVSRYKYIGGSLYW